MHAPDASRPGATAVYHGGNLAAARRRFPDAPQPWLDLSTGINPIAYPVGDLAPDAWRALTPADEIAALEQAAARAYGATDPETIVAAPGTQALIQWLPRLLPAARVGILGFTYQEHAAVWRASGATVEIVETPEDLQRFDLGVIVNPNNPDGRLLPVGALEQLAGHFSARGATLVLDEAFVDVLPACASLAPRLPPSGVVVLRSFGKTYGLAGLRLGFAVAPRAIAERFRTALGPWAISGPAVAIGRRALDDRAWLTVTVARLIADAARLDRMLAAAGLRTQGGTPLFRLAAHSDAGAWFEHFGRAGILVRPFPDRPDWLRFGLPGAPDAWDRLQAALASGPASESEAIGP